MTYATPSAGMSMPGVQGSASYPAARPNTLVPGAPGMIGSSGYATAPTSEVQRQIPVMGRMGAANSTPYGSVQ